MKNQLSTLLLFGLLLGSGTMNSLFAQKNWRWQNPLPQGNTLRGSSTPDLNTVIFVGDAGTIIKSSDKGNSWTHQNSNTREDLYAISFFDLNNGMAVGTDGTILSTNDCGQTWKKLISGRNDTLRDVTFSSLNFAVTVGDTGTILRTKNGGNNWAYEPIPGFKPKLNGVFFPTPDFGTIVGDSFPGFGGPPIVFTGDSGTSFAPLGPGNPGLTGNFNAVWMPKADPNKAVLVGDEGKILNTHDGGINWNAPLSGTTVPIEDVWFFDDKNGFATGPNGVLLRTKNCGDTWSAITPPIQGDLLTLRFPDSLNGYMGGENGGLVRTGDGGSTFEFLRKGFVPNLTDVTFLDDSFGIAVGGQGAILRTPDAGDSWLPVNIGSTWDWESVTTARDGSGGLWAAGGIFGDSARIIFSGDSGLNWTPRPIPSPVKLFDITFRDSLNGMAVGLNGLIYCTKNGGNSWQLKFSGSSAWLLAVDMPTDTSAYIAGGFGTILKTNNFGTTWTPLSSGTNEWLTSVSFLDDSTGMCAGNHGVVLRTRNAGNSWEDVSPPGITIDFTDLSLFSGIDVSNKTASNDFAATIIGQNGLILSSSDGGDTWIQQDSKTKHLLKAAFFTDSITGTVVGSYGTILRTDGTQDTIRVGLEEGPVQPISSANPLGQNFPNPVTEVTYIPFTLSTAAYTQLSVYNMSGEKVSQLVDQQLPFGAFQFEWRPAGLPSGIYLYRLQVDHQVYSGKMMLME